MKNQFDRSWMPEAKPFVISGPCSAESLEQVISTAEALKSTGKVHLLRAGIWKPRTRPDSFHGVGVIGLKWLVEARAITGLPFAVEVANASHVEACLNSGADAIWIGARTTVNPFSVQEIADALKGVDIPVMIKNPINPDPDLWLGAIERILHSGNQKIAAIHRGFSRYRASRYRNAPEWDIPIEIMNRMPGVPMLCDPSHICGNRELLQDVSQKAMDLGYDGLMIESHISPEKAWSDGDQQLTPANLLLLLKALTIRQHKQVNAPEELEELRSKIDHIDEEMIGLIATRMSISDEIGRFKKDHNLEVLQTERWNEIVQHVLNSGANLHLSREFLVKLLNAIHQESINRQVEIMNKTK